MRKLGWYNIVFFACLLVDVLFAILYWTVLTDNAMYAKYYTACWSIFYAFLWVNIVCQMFAVVRKKPSGVSRLVLGTIAWYVTILLTTAVSV